MFKKESSNLRGDLLSRLAKWFQNSSKTIKGIVFGSLLIILALMPLGGNWWTRVLINTGLMLLCALGLNVVLGNVGQFHLGFVAYYGFGAYFYAILASPHKNIHLPFLLIFILAGISTGILGALISVPTSKLRGDYLALVTLAVGEVFYLLVNSMQLTNASLGIMNIDKPVILGWEVNTPAKFYYLIWILAIITAVLFHRLSSSRIGRGMASIREDEDAASSMGVDTKKLKILANGIGAIPAGLAGVLFAASQSFVSPVSFTIADSTLILSFVVVGGVANVPGVILGVLLLTILPEPLRKYTANMRILLYAILLLFFAIRRPQGLWKANHLLTKLKNLKVVPTSNDEAQATLKLER